MIDGSEALTGPRDLTKNQLIQLVNMKCGGWPIKAAAIFQFESKDPKETVYRFVDENDMSLESKKFRKLTGPLWTKRVTFDDYVLKYLSRQARESIVAEAKQDLVKRLQAAL